MATSTPEAVAAFAQMGQFVVLLFVLFFIVLYVVTDFLIKREDHSAVIFGNGVRIDRR